MKLKCLILVLCLVFETHVFMNVKEKIGDDFRAQSAQNLAQNQGAAPTEPPTQNIENSNPPSSPSDATYNRITEFIYSMAEDAMKTSDLLKKKKISGSLPEGYPTSTRRLALKTRDDKEKWRRVLGLPTELYRFCIYSNSNINYYKWCNNNFFGSKNKRDSKYILNLSI